MMYDFMSKEILNPEFHPERLNEFISLLLGQPAEIVEVLPNDGTRLADESTKLWHLGPVALYEEMINPSV